MRLMNNRKQLGNLLVATTTLCFCSTVFLTTVSAFVVPFVCHAAPSPHPQAKIFSLSAISDDSDDSGQVGSGPNWIERSFPVAADEKVDPKRVDDYNLRVSGESFGTGPLSMRMYEAIVSKSSLKIANPQIQRAWKLYAMDFTAKEAVRAALQENGLELTLTDDEQDEGMWGDVDSIRLLDKNGATFGPFYESWEQVVDDWTPGTGFDFVVRQVPAKMAKLSVGQLLAALDPDGSLRKQAKDVGASDFDSGDDDDAIDTSAS